LAFFDTSAAYRNISIYASRGALFQELGEGPAENEKLPQRLKPQDKYRTFGAASQAAEKRHGLELFVIPL
jgi:hypothetical protein